MIVALFIGTNNARESVVLNRVKITDIMAIVENKKHQSTHAICGNQGRLNINHLLSLPPQIPQYHNEKVIILIISQPMTIWLLNSTFVRECSNVKANMARVSGWQTLRY